MNFWLPISHEWVKSKFDNICCVVYPMLGDGYNAIWRRGHEDRIFFSSCQYTKWCVMPLHDTLPCVLMLNLSSLALNGSQESPAEYFGRTSKSCKPLLPESRISRLTHSNPFSIKVTLTIYLFL